MIRPLLPLPCLALVLGCFIPSSVRAQMGFPPAKPVEATLLPVFADGQYSEQGPFANFRLKLDYTTAKAAILHLGESPVPLPAGEHQLELLHDHPVGGSGKLWTRLDGAHLLTSIDLPSGPGGENAAFDDPALRCEDNFSVSVVFENHSGSGTLFSKCAPGNATWTPDAKALFIRGGRLVYDIGWVGHITGKPRVNDGKRHHAILVVSDGNAEIFLNGKTVAQRRDFSRPDKKGHVFKIGDAAPDFGKPFKGKAGSQIARVTYFPRALPPAERKTLFADPTEPPNDAALNWVPSATAETFDGAGIEGVPVTLTLDPPASFVLHSATLQALGTTDHAEHIRGWNAETLATGKQIYNTLCVTCHGTPETPGTLPTALRFHEQPFKNGADPYRMFQTLDKGYGLMVPQSQYTAAQKYAVIHYIRETFLKPHNPTQYVPVTDATLAKLPAKLPSHKDAIPAETTASGPAYKQMDFGPSLMWTYQVNRGERPNNTAQKGIAVRLDPGPGGVSKGKAWMVYDQDTMRVAAVTTAPEPAENDSRSNTGDAFIDWRGIAFDGSHGTHASLTGDPLFLTPDAPAWAHPTRRDFADARITGRDGRRYGPLPRDWVHYKGLYHHGDDVVLRYTVGETEILEQPGWISYGDGSIFTRTLNIGPADHAITTRLCPVADDLALTVKTADVPRGVYITTSQTDGHWTLNIPARKTPIRLIIAFSRLDRASADSLLPEPADLAPLTSGGPARFTETVTTQGHRNAHDVEGDDDAPFEIDTLTIPNRGDNPWHAWMRLGGFDFLPTPDNPAGDFTRAAVCTWLGDVWLVDGITGDLSALRWRRICSGLFQPLGLKFHNGKIHVTCRDQIARLHDLNGDDEIDYVESVNNDHQVTEHFHEFAMGLQIDEDGNYYYAKSARHAKTALVPHHGTLLRVSADGQRTDIVATGFRAANGVCLNPDGTFFVTDQEGHWMPKNRINHVREGGFYGNIFGYHDVTDTADDAMEQPLAWITNAKDRSPAELLWVPEDGNWGALNGTLLNLSYGYGQIYAVPHETIDGQWQGGVCEFPMARLPSGLHRGRFHPTTKDLYGVGMFAWAGNQRADGGFYRIRATGKPAHLPLGICTAPETLTLTFTDPLPPDSTFRIKTWDIKRTANYGSRHHNEIKLEVADITIHGPTATLRVPDLTPTWCMEIACDLGGIQRVIHNTIHQIPEP